MADLYTTITKASIFRRGAELVRRGSAELEEGAQTVTVRGLTQSANIDTARLFSQEGVFCSDLRFAPQYGEDEEDPRAAELKDRIRELEKEIEVKELQRELWKSNGDFSARNGQPLSEVQEYIEKLPERLGGLNREILRGQKELEELNRKLEKLSEQSSSPVMVAEVVAPAAGTYAFELRYFENAAGWQPVYEVHSDGETDLEMRMRARIHQNTTEDWKGVETSLLTGNPTSAGSVPDLLSLFLDIRQNRPVMKAKAAGMARMAMDEDCCMEEAAEAPMMPFGASAQMNMARMATMDAGVNEDQTSTEYVLPGRRDVLKTGDNTADIRSYRIPAVYRIVSVPSLDQSAYLVASVKPSDLPVTAEINPSVYHKGIYTGKIWLDPDLTREEIEITLGKEERIHLSREQTARKTSTSLLKGRRTVEYGYETRVSNTSSADAQVVIRDQVPVSQNKDISVEVLEISGAELAKESGLLTKALDVPAGGSAVFRVGYRVSSPRDKQISEERRRVSSQKFCPECGSPMEGGRCDNCGFTV